MTIDQGAARGEAVDVTPRVPSRMRGRFTGGLKMPRRLTVLLFVALFAAEAQPARAQTGEDRIIAQLRDQGFDEIVVSRTLLGRVRIVAIEDDTIREIVLNPATGAILRDYWSEIEEDDDKGRGRGRGGDDYDDEEDDTDGEARLLDNEDDDDDDDDKDDD